MERADRASDGRGPLPDMSTAEPGARPGPRCAALRNVPRSAALVGRGGRCHLRPGCRAITSAGTRRSVGTVVRSVSHGVPGGRAPLRGQGGPVEGGQGQRRHRPADGRSLRGDEHPDPAGPLGWPGTGPNRRSAAGACTAPAGGHRHRGRAVLIVVRVGGVLSRRHSGSVRAARIVENGDCREGGGKCDQRQHDDPGHSSSNSARQVCLPPLPNPKDSAGE